MGGLFIMGSPHCSLNTAATHFMLGRLRVGESVQVGRGIEEVTGEVGVGFGCTEHQPVAGTGLHYLTDYSQRLCVVEIVSILQMGKLRLRWFSGLVQRQR